MDKLRRTLRPKPSKATTTSTSDQPIPSNPSLAIRNTNAKRIRSDGSSLSLTSGPSKAARASKKARKSDSRHQASKAAQEDARQSSPDDWSDAAIDVEPVLAEVTDSQLRRPPWTVRHQIYLDNHLISCITSSQRAGYHKFADFLLREQIETRLYHAHNGLDAHFATRHATLRFWQTDGMLQEKWMDKDMGGLVEHEFAMENMNDWTILHLAIGGEDALDGEGQGEQDGQDGQEGDQKDDAQARSHDNDEAMETDDDKDTADDDHDTTDEADEEPDSQPTMDVTSHYLSDYEDARSIAAAPLGTDSNTGSHTYRWVEDRRRKLEHQLLEWYQCSEPSCFNKGGTCIAIAPSQHVHVDVKDLTDWSQQIAHANRSIAASTLHLAAKLIDDQVRAQDERLANVGRERDDEDDLGEAMRLHPVLASLRPSQDTKAELEPLD